MKWNATRWQGGEEARREKKEPAGFSESSHNGSAQRTDGSIQLQTMQSQLSGFRAVCDVPLSIDESIVDRRIPVSIQRLMTRESTR